MKYPVVSPLAYLDRGDPIVAIIDVEESQSAVRAADGDEEQDSTPYEVVIEVRSDLHGRIGGATAVATVDEVVTYDRKLANDVPPTGERLTITAKAEPKAWDGGWERGAVEATLLVLPSDLGVVGSPRYFPPADPARIAAYERATGTTFRPDYRHFLHSVNGLDMVWHRRPQWLSHKPGFFEAILDIEEALGPSDFGDDLSHFLGLGVPDNSLEQPDPNTEDPELGFYDLRLYPHGYLVGADGGGNNAVQVARGRYAGQIKMIDHAVYYGGIEEVFALDTLTLEERKAYPFASFEEADTDDLWELWDRWEMAYTVAASFDEFLERNVLRQMEIMARMPARFRATR